MTDIAREHGGFRLEAADGKVERAAWVIGADGTASSLVRRRLRSRFDATSCPIATGFLARGTSSDEIVPALVGDPPGYIWSFPRPDHLAIGICAEAGAGHTAGAFRACAPWNLLKPLPGVSPPPRRAGGSTIGLGSVSYDALSRPRAGCICRGENS